jgi:hypothetical protein
VRSENTNGVNLDDCNIVRLWTACPKSEKLTPYDVRNLCLYANLLDAELDGVQQREVARVLFRIDFDRHRSLALKAIETHRERAHWIQKNVMPFLNW